MEGVESVEAGQCLWITPKNPVGFWRMCLHMPFDVDYEQQGQSKHLWEYNICPFLTLNLLKWYKSVEKSVNVKYKQKKSANM